MLCRIRCNKRAHVAQWADPWSITAEQIQRVLVHFGLALELLPVVQIELEQSLFVRAAEAIVEQAVRIASGLVLDRLRANAARQEMPSADVPAGLNAILKLIFWLEEIVRRTGVRLPFGGSTVLVAVKPNGTF